VEQSRTFSKIRHANGVDVVEPPVPACPPPITYTSLGEARHPAGSEVPAGSRARNRQAKKGGMTQGLPHLWLAPTRMAAAPTRARKGRYDQLTIFLLQECQLRGTHFDNCAECKNLRGRQDNDTYAVLADCKCIPPSTHPTEEVAANRGAHATTQCSHAIAYRPAVQSVPRALGCV
jgi:hypothetical protein